MNLKALAEQLDLGRPLTGYVALGKRLNLSEPRFCDPRHEENSNGVHGDYWSVKHGQS